MSLLTQHDADARSVRRATRRFLLVAILVTLALMAAIFVRQGLLRQTVSYSFVADTAQDIAKGQAVRIAGFRVGSVTDVDLRDDGSVAVKLDVDADHARFVTHDARIELRKEGLVGSPTMEIVPGADKTRLAAAQARLAFSRADGLGALANQVRDEFIPILKDIKAITGALADPEKGLPGTLARIRASSEALNVLLANGNRQVEGIGGTAIRVLGKAEEDLTHLGQTLEAANKRLPGMLDRTRQVLDHVEKISAEAEASVPPALRDGSAVAADVREIVGGAKQTWPISSMVDAPAPARLKPDSDPRGEAGRAR
ncbi:MCE family protein [Sulfuritalea sp.]|uniref:MlaD family protein n=1 Tax=Sulfuritalea sp. TaxID=2480090 RepID=UPI001AC482ED|nr:MCE family protein [Sulfuritalea sp.]MBN8475111.1 MCE family protein [Sulfuritalea sp.]